MVGMFRQPPRVPCEALLPQGQSVQPIWSPPSPLQAVAKVLRPPSRFVNPKASEAVQPVVHGVVAGAKPPR
jgi:hypothetical protein